MAGFESNFPLQVVNLEQSIFAMLKLVSFLSLAWNDLSERGTQAEAHCERNLNRQL